MGGGWMIGVRSGCRKLIRETLRLYFYDLEHEFTLRKMFDSHVYPQSAASTCQQEDGAGEADEGEGRMDMVSTLGMFLIHTVCLALALAFYGTKHLAIRKLGRSRLTEVRLDVDELEQGKSEVTHQVSAYEVRMMMQQVQHLLDKFEGPETARSWADSPAGDRSQLAVLPGGLL
eukprot:gb/GFBE01076642.1/.p1 GENE.gb/GFBE01076642.1/~~gb/GFBE01076642.1/.p1  ORF type:complete len:174 (+),score=23.20 gb/GFBE01076642.1/:1-522(+)